ncbi:MAG: hypothetical protein KKB21_03070 [Nanoarchaeota archaeon]|nr:hypothetical protein [Nanoarchaeota archaeon]MBU4086533.1 hypothetical protein [Nanoarchaeota archaeon]
MAEKELEELTDRQVKGWLRVIHPIPISQDGTCLHIEWMGEDLVHCPGVGEWKCKLQENNYGDLLYGGGSENLDYKPCNHPNHGDCQVYLAEMRKRTSVV